MDLKDFLDAFSRFCVSLKAAETGRNASGMTWNTAKLTTALNKLYEDIPDLKETK